MTYHVRFTMLNVDSEALAIATGTACLVADAGAVDIADVSCAFYPDQSEAKLEYVLRLDQETVEELRGIADYSVTEA